MNSRIWQFALLFIGLLALQVLLFDNIELFGFLNPYIYVLFVLLLPVDTSPLVAMPLAFAQGLTLDLFSSTLGLHATANTILAFVRPYILRSLSDRDPNKSSIVPSMVHFGAARASQYVLAGVSIHHLALYLIAAATLDEMLKTLLQAGSNILFTSFLLLVALAIVNVPTSKTR